MRTNCISEGSKDAQLREYHGNGEHYTPAENNSKWPQIICYRCDQVGHIAKICQEMPDRQGYRTLRSWKRKAHELGDSYPQSAAYQDPNRDLELANA